MRSDMMGHQKRKKKFIEINKFLAHRLSALHFYSIYGIRKSNVYNSDIFYFDPINVDFFLFSAQVHVRAPAVTAQPMSVCVCTCVKRYPETFRPHFIPTSP